MRKFINYLLFCNLLLFCYCKLGTNIMTPSSEQSGSPMNSFKGDSVINSSDKEIEEKIQPSFVALTTEEQNKFDVLIHGFNKIIEAKNDLLSVDQMKKYKDFIDYLSKDVSRQRELAHAFQYVYDYLEKKRPLQAGNLTVIELISNTLINSGDNINSRYDGSIDLEMFFRNVLLQTINTPDHNTNEKMFEYLKAELRNPQNHVAGLVGAEEILQILEARFGKNQVQALDFLRETLVPKGSYEYKDIVKGQKVDALLQLSDTKIKATLTHIHQEYSKCSDNAVGENRFKDKLREFFDKNEVNDTTMEQLLNEVRSECG
ncbi:Mlp family lipoprotein [Borrelia persica]|uniref:Mlp family lipoprotein n=1 Tax=Borrelia persica TaxID=44448 RepID=UPI000467B271|nr:Mlp family lipoprotein [Borrelia persica]